MFNIFSVCSCLTDVYCYAIEPPSVKTQSEDEFWDGYPFNQYFIKEHTTLHVPASSLEKYKAALRWSDFGNIVAIAASGKILPFVQDGKVWTYEASNFNYEWEETNSLEGDTVISSRKCLRLYYSCQHFNENHLYKGAMFEEGGNVYVIVPGSTTPVLLYDFSSEPGTIFKVGEFEIKIKEKKLVKYRGEYLRVFDYCITENEDYPFGGVEGLGFFGGGLTCLLEGGVPGSTGGIRYIKTCTLDGEVIYEAHDFYASTQIVKEDDVYFTKDQMATIILPTEPDAGKGKYYRLDRCEEGQIIFEQEKQPQARTPYIIVPDEDFSIDPSTMDLAGLSPDTASIGGIYFIGSYSRNEPVCQEGWYIDIIDATPDCGFSSLEEAGKGAFIGALRAYLTVNWDDPVNHDGLRGPKEKLGIVLKDNGTGISSLTPDPSHGRGEWFMLDGRKVSGKPSQKGIYIRNGKKVVIKR